MFSGNNNFVTPPPPPYPAPTVVIGTQQWMSQNLDIATYRNGDIIPQVTDPTAWNNLTTGAWCYYNNDPANGLIYGKLYNWYAVNDPRGLAPNGWHIPTDTEWNTLSASLGGDAISGGKMKSNSNTWTSNSGASNSSGFSGLPGGVRNDSGSPFYRIGSYSYFWSSTTGGSGAWYRSLENSNSVLSRYDGYFGYGFSIRCVKDEPAPFQAPAIVQNGLLLNLDAANPASYSGSGTTWNDLSGNNNHGTLAANNSGSLPVFQNGSFYFNGTSSYVSIVSSVIPNSGSFSVSTWAKMSSGRFTEMINTRNASTVTGFLLTSSGSDIRAQINNPSFNQFVFSGTHSTVQDDTWHLITITVDGTTRTMNAYVDNVFISSNNFTAGSLVGQSNFVIGWDYAWSGGAEYFRGSIATVSVYNYALSNTEVTTNFNATKTRFGL